MLKGKWNRRDAIRAKRLRERIRAMILRFKQGKHR